MCVFLIWLKVAILARTALLFSIWVGSIVQLDTYEKRHVYEWDDHPVIGRGQRERIFTMSRNSRARRRMWWTIVGAILAIFIQWSFIVTDSFLRISSFLQSLWSTDWRNLSLHSLRYHSEAELLSCRETYKLQLSKTQWAYGPTHQSRS